MPTTSGEHSIPFHVQKIVHHLASLDAQKAFDGASLKNHWQFGGFTQSGLKWYIKKNNH